ncbi:TetR/AcrR family transcriptional regulator [Roseburia rectibacter]|nr:MULTISPECIES: TetR/AcrR family transcriptional regulator [Roseburia]UMZ01610.1 TetR/AcrR family transcriptional regulator [Roseburia rectibacter]
MTKQLVCANITCVMEDERRKQTEQKLIRSGRAEFLKKGYVKASLRDICKAAGVTTGAFYFSFESKEALMTAILDPVIADYEHMCAELAQREEEDPGTADDNERQIMEYLSEHRAEAIILMERSEGSRYEGFRQKVYSQMQAAFTSYFSKFMGSEPDSEMIRILVAMRLRGYMELIEGDYTVEERLKLAREIGIHADAGSMALIQYLKEQREVYRR